MSHAELEPALEELRPVAWVEPLPDEGAPPCGLHCMRQFVKLETCIRLVEAHERACGARYTWVVKARPDLTFTSTNPPADRATSPIDTMIE